MTAGAASDRERSSRPCLGVVVGAVVLATASLGGCSDDESGTIDERTEGSRVDADADDDERDGENVDEVEADGVTVALTPTSRQDGERFEVTFSFTVTNATTTAVFVPEVTGGGGGQLDGTTLRVRYARPVGDPSSSGGDSPLPPTDGLVLDAGATLEGETTDGSRYDGIAPPTTAEVCVEVLADGFDAVGDGTATAPYRHPDEPATVACSGPVPLATG